MSLLLLIDGYNVVSPVAVPSQSVDPNWLQRERMRLIDRLATLVDAGTRQRTCVVFDAANPPRDRPSEFQYHGISVRFAIDYPEADDLLEEIIGQHSAPKRLAVISSDRRVQTAASRRGAACFDSQPWLDALLEGRLQLAVSSSRAGQGSHEKVDKPNEDLDRGEISDWMREFGFEDHC